VTTPVRLLDMGAPRYMVALSLQMVLAQRLVRLICESCAEPYNLLPGEHEWLAQELGSKFDSYRYVKGRGCSHCNGTGYLGRIGVYEMLEMTKPVVEAANQADPARFLEVATREMGGRTLRAHAAQLVADGKTTVEEGLRVSSQFEE
jgi:MSHA biogenesis protein MshE